MCGSRDVSRSSTVDPVRRQGGAAQAEQRQAGRRDVSPTARGSQGQSPQPRARPDAAQAWLPSGDELGLAIPSFLSPPPPSGCLRPGTRICTRRRPSARSEQMHMQGVGLRVSAQQAGGGAPSPLPPEHSPETRPASRKLSLVGDGAPAADVEGGGGGGGPRPPHSPVALTDRDAATSILWWPSSGASLTMTELTLSFSIHTHLEAEAQEAAAHPRTGQHPRHTHAGHGRGRQCHPSRGPPPASPDPRRCLVLGPRPAGSLPPAGTLRSCSPRAWAPARRQP